MSLWTQEAILKLINAYHARRYLWDNTDPEYADRNQRNTGWKEIADEVGFDVMTVERKLKSLKTHLLAVHKAYAKRRQKVNGTTSAVAKPKWFAYEPLSFLVKGRSPRIARQVPNPEKQSLCSSAQIEWKHTLQETVPSPSPPPSASTSTSVRDEFTVFAEHVAIRMRNITDRRSRLVAQHQINNILFEAEIGKYNIQAYGSGIMDGLDEPSTSNDERMMSLQ